MNARVWFLWAVCFCPLALGSQTNGPLCGVELLRARQIAIVMSADWPDQIDNNFLTLAIENVEFAYPELAGIRARNLSGAALRTVLEGILHKTEKGLKAGDSVQVHQKVLSSLFPPVVFALYFDFEWTMVEDNFPEASLLSLYRHLLSKISKPEITQQFQTNLFIDIDIEIESQTAPALWRSALEEWVNLQIESKKLRAYAVIHQKLADPVVFMTFSLERAGRVLGDQFGQRFVGIRHLNFSRETLFVLVSELLNEILQSPYFLENFHLIFPELYQGYLEMSLLSGGPVNPAELVEYTKRILSLPNGIVLHRAGVLEARAAQARVDERRGIESQIAAEVSRQGLDPIPQNSTEQRVHDRLRRSAELESERRRVNSGNHNYRIPMDSIRPAPGWGVKDN